MSSFSERLCYMLIGTNGGQNQINAALFCFQKDLFLSGLATQWYDRKEWNWFHTGLGVHNLNIPDLFNHLWLMILPLSFPTLVPSPEAPRSPLHEVMMAGRMMEAKQRMRQQRKARDRRRRERKRAARSREFNREFKNTSSLGGVLIGPGCQTFISDILGL